MSFFSCEGGRGILKSIYPAPAATDAPSSKNQATAWFLVQALPILVQVFFRAFNEGIGLKFITRSS